MAWRLGTLSFQPLPLFPTIAWSLSTARKIPAYGALRFIEPQKFKPEDISITCQDLLISLKLAARMEGKHCKLGAMLTSDTFVTGRDNRLELGAHYNCLACDMESGAFAYVAQDKLKTPWFNLRIVFQ